MVDEDAVEQALRDSSSAYQEIQEAEQQLLPARLGVLSTHSAVGGLYLAMMAGVVIAGCAATRERNGAFGQSILVEVSSALATFAAAPLALSVGARHNRVLAFLCVCGSFVCIFAGYFASGVAQSFFIEGAVAALSLLVLEVFVRKAQEAAEARRAVALAKLRSTKERLERARAKAESAESVLDWEFAAADLFKIPRMLETYGGIGSREDEP